MENSSKRIPVGSSMTVFQRYVKGKRYNIFSKMMLIPANKKLLWLCLSALFPLHIRQNWLNTCPPPFVPGRCVEGDESKPEDPSLERLRPQQPVRHWDQEAQGSSRLPGASAHDQGSRKT